MKIKLVGLLVIVFASIGFISCIDQENTIEAIFEKDLKAIEEYVATSNLVNVKEFNDPVLGIRVIWQELSNSGVKIARGDTISTDYTGRLLANDAIFDTSIEAVAVQNNIFSSQRRYVPLRFRTSSNSSPQVVISGFEYGLLQMERGDKATILIPSEYAYGNNPPQGIPQNAPLIFEVDLIEVKAGPQQ
ncbi:MAG: FKBP-type peptidyl-prolyl cis-trans isomerase [Algoriphagus sp.]|jgi:FKBP-type peptidyl-prolyl cis-trans isomerase FkpA|uniref:FKBP-type peptidyl-prolyl cis-trans isomerase n=1 Tax=Algoriphagus sp. TaxID=1872435 RepID=UPI0026398A52|nr:FKBP-type peptidyl-prolyl cis-trans isomerase [Algoriphagus sp.]MDG1276242.1 FKBP-type peptidyl-prolyl cis-trans isomerase [Algoriphagus sp.]